MLEFDHEEDVQSGQIDRLDGEEITGEHAGGLGAQELRPARAAAVGRGSEVVAAQDGAHRCRRHPYAELAALADDAQVSPAGVFSGQAQHEVDDFWIQLPAASAVGRVGPPPADQLAVPTKKGRRRDEEDRPALAGQQPRSPCEDHPVGWRVAGPGYMPAQDQQLVA
jgi:hypothetical protein